MRFEDWLELLVSPDGKSVLCCNHSKVAIEAFDAYLTNFAVSAALLQQGEEPLHATVVETRWSRCGTFGTQWRGKVDACGPFDQPRLGSCHRRYAKNNISGQRSFCTPRGRSAKIVFAIR